MAITVGLTKSGKCAGMKMPFAPHLYVIAAISFVVKCVLTVLPCALTRIRCGCMFDGMSEMMASPRSIHLSLGGWENLAHEVLALVPVHMDVVELRSE